MLNGVGFTGTREGWSAAQASIMPSVFKSLLLDGQRWLHEGDCVGADAEANELWRSLGGKIHQHPPTDKSSRAFSPFDMQREPKEYLQRDRAIVDHSSVLVATPKTMVEITRSGTWYTVRHARKLMHNILIVLPNGEISLELF